MSTPEEILRSGGRAVTAKDKRAVIERLYAAWCAFPDQRLGQLIVNACSARSTSPLFYTEDEGLCVAAERYAKIGAKK